MVLLDAKWYMGNAKHTDNSERERERERERDPSTFRDFSTYSFDIVFAHVLSMSLCVQSFQICTTSTVIVLVPYTQ